LTKSGGLILMNRPPSPLLHEGAEGTLRLQQWTTIQELARQGLNISDIQRETGFAWNTVKKYLAAPPPAAAPSKNVKPQVLDRFQDHIRSRLTQYPQLTARRLFHEVQEIGYTGGETRVKDFIRTIRTDRKVRAVWRFETPPGEQAQVDWARLRTMLVDGRPRRVYAFVMVLGYSRYRFVRFVTEQDTATFIRLHLEAFAFFGGVPRTVLYDNLRNVVIERGPDSERRQWNELFRDFFQTLGFRPHLCAPYQAQTKGKVERSIRFLRDDFLEGREFASLEEMNFEVQAWLRKVNLERPNDTTGRIPSQMLAEEGLTPLDPNRPYVITQGFLRRVKPESLVHFQGNMYSVPWDYAGREAMVRLTGKILSIEVAGEEVARHELRSGRGQRVKLKEHYDGLLKALRSTNRETEEWRRAKYAFEEVAQRPLDEYDRLLEEVTR